MNKKANTINPRDLNLIRNYLLGGAALGGAAGVGTSLMNYINTLKKEQPSNADDDDVLYLHLPAGQKSAVLGGGLALAGGTLATVGSYALARKIYQSIKRKRIQEELDKAQEGYTDAITTEAKAASVGKPMGFTEFLTSAPVALPLLLGVGSGILANRALEQAFPARRKRLKLGPRKVVLLRDGEQPPSPDQLDNPMAKGAAYDPEDDAMELLVGISLGLSKQATDLSDLLGALAAGRAQEMRQVADSAGTEAMLDMVKGASDKSVSPQAHGMALGFSIKSAEFSPVVKMLAAAEFANACPAFFKLAQHVDQESADAIVGIMGYLGAAVRSEQFAPCTKEAAVLADSGAPQGIDPKALEMLLAMQHMGPQAHDEKLTDQYDSASSRHTPGAKHDNASEDFIDHILSGNDMEQNVTDEHAQHEEHESHAHDPANKRMFTTPEA